MTEARFTFADAIARLDVGIDKSRKGQLFERVMKRYFMHDPVYKQRFTNVWLWSDEDNPMRSGQDYGIDLVAREQDGTFTAIQCKFYNKGQPLAWPGLTKFLAATSRKNSPYEEKILVYTGKQLTEKQMEEINHHNCRLIDYKRLYDSKVQWDELSDLGKPIHPAKQYEEADHQKDARNAVVSAFKNSKVKRGKLIMACGTGKTFTTLLTSEEILPKGGTVLYLVPSISLLQQTMREWAEQKRMPHEYIGVCSDTRAGRNDEDASLAELEIPVTTDKTRIAQQLKSRQRKKLTVVFSTYQSLAEVSAAQKTWGNPFDLVICDEAHRTVGVGTDAPLAQPNKTTAKKKAGTLKNSTSPFVAVHDDKFIRAKLRLYTTATPKVYSPRTKTAMKAAGEQYGKDFVAYSMDKEEWYGKELYRLNFSTAITNGLLSDYRVVVLTVTEDEAAVTLNNIADKSPKLNIEKTAKMIGCWRALTDPEIDGLVIGDDGASNPKPRNMPLQRAIAFCNNIKESVEFNEDFPRVAGEASGDAADAKFPVWHTDGRHNALERRNRLVWLEESDKDETECRILTNARCLTEGIDVPTLDAVIFMGNKSSPVDIIQAVGRVMRSSRDKTYGYIIIPIVVKKGASIQMTLEGSDEYGQVWNVVRALRSHDDRIDQYLVSGKIPNLVWRMPPDTLQNQPRGPSSPILSDVTYDDGLDIESLLRLIRTRLADKVGDTRYLESWAVDVAKIVERISLRMQVLIKTTPDIERRFNAFHAGLKEIINDYITEAEAISMLSQHIVMGRVFDTLFQSTTFTKGNPISNTLGRILAALRENGLESELDNLEDFYKDVEARVKEISTNAGRQRVIYELYDKFFAHAFKKTATRLGIVYTPVEIVDFTLRSAESVLYNNFARHLSGRNVHIIDPFAGTGTFITRLLSADLHLVQKRDLEYKFEHEIHASEIMLMAYYVAAANCEMEFLERNGGAYTPFRGLVLTDTFHEKSVDEAWTEGPFTTTQAAIERLRKTPITVVIGNPPWSMGAKLYEGESRPEYPGIDAKIRETYMAKTRSSGAKNYFKDSYVRALRWASSRLGADGVIAFVTNAGFLRRDTASGIRACLTEEFNEIWLVDLRGEKGIPGDGRNIFEYAGKSTGGTTLSSVVVILVKNSKRSGCTIKYHGLPESTYSGSEKRQYLGKFGSIENIAEWHELKLDKFNDWLDHRNTNFHNYPVMGTRSAKKSTAVNAVFKLYARGVGTSRDPWAYNSSYDEVAENMKQCISHCNAQAPNKPKIDQKRGKWTKELKDRLKRKKPQFDKSNIRAAMYRPFFEQHLYYDDVYVNTPGIVPLAFPDADSDNKVIAVPYKFRGEFSAIITNVIPDLHVIKACQCFPLFVYNNGVKSCNMTDEIRDAFQVHYNDKRITKLQIFHYIYAMFHHPGYKEKYANNLIREFPRIPFAPEFRTFVRIGKDLAKLHIGYKDTGRYPLEAKTTVDGFKKISFKKKDGPGHGGRLMTIDDKTAIMVDNKTLLVENIPTISYKVDGRTPLEWVVNRYKRKTDKNSGIVNDPCMNTDIMDKIQMAVHIGVETDKLIAALPDEFEPPESWSPPKGPLFQYNSDEFDDYEDDEGDNSD